MDKEGASREYLYGVHPVREAIRAGRRNVFKVILASLDTWKEFLHPLEELLKKRSIGIEIKTRNEISGMCRSPENQGIAAQVSAYPYAAPETVLAGRGPEPPLYLALDGVQDPHNLGGILRSAECCGAAGVFLPSRHSAPITPAVVKASAGASEHLKVSRIGNLAAFIEVLKRKEVWVYGLEADGDKLWVEADMTGPTALILGGEGEGLRRLVRERCDAVIRLPVGGKLGCLNVSVTAGVALYEAMRQRGRR